MDGRHRVDNDDWAHRRRVNPSAAWYNLSWAQHKQLALASLDKDLCSVATTVGVPFSGSLSCTNLSPRKAIPGSLSQGHAAEDRRHANAPTCVADNRGPVHPQKAGHHRCIDVASRYTR